jgi:hypothetical protein
MNPAQFPFSWKTRFNAIPPTIYRTTYIPNGVWFHPRAPQIGPRAMATI